MGSGRINVTSVARLILGSFGFAAVWLAITLLFGSDSARADAGRTLTGPDDAVPSLVSGAAGTVEQPVTQLSPGGSSVADVVAPADGPAAPPVAPVAPVADRGTSAVPPTVTPIASAAAPVTNAVAPIVSVVAPVTDAVAMPVVQVVTASRSELTEIAVGSPVGSLVTPLAETVDRTVAGLPVVNDAVSGILGDAPLTRVTTPVTDAADELLPVTLGGSAVDPGLPGLPGLPDSPPALPGEDRPEVDGVTAVLPSAVDPPAAAVDSRAPDAGITSALSVLAGLNFRSDDGPTTSNLPHPNPVPQGPANKGTPAPSSASGRTAGSASAGFSGFAAYSSFPQVPALIAGALLSHAENDALPSSIARDLPSTPD